MSLSPPFFSASLSRFTTSSPSLHRSGRRNYKYHTEIDRGKGTTFPHRNTIKQHHLGRHPTTPFFLTSYTPDLIPNSPVQDTSEPYIPYSSFPSKRRRHSRGLTNIDCRLPENTCPFN